MTQSAQTKKSPNKPKVVVTEPLEPELKEPPVREEPKTEVDILIERLRDEKPQVYESYVAALKAQKRAFIYPDLTVRIG